MHLPSFLRHTKTNIPAGENESGMGEIRIGTSGYSYEDWKGLFYPKGMPSSDFLSYYSNFFDCVEIDSTYYRIPEPSVMDAIARKVPASFRFIVKTPDTFTHKRTKFLEALEPFRRATKPMIKKGVLACYLAQFPSSFRFTKENLEHIANIAGNLDAPVCVEFRARLWQNEEVNEFLREKEIGYVNVDLPSFKTLPAPSSVATSEVGFVRLHGRNLAKWWHHKEAHERYDYTYKTQELEQWVPQIRDVQENTQVLYIMFNNHWRKQSVDAANAMKKLLGIEPSHEQKGGALTDYFS